MAEDLVAAHQTQNIVEDLRLVVDAAASEQEIESAIRGLLLRIEPNTVRSFRDHVAALLREARAGKVSVVGGTVADDRVVLISARQLASIVAIARRPRSFAEALAAMPDFVGIKEPVQMAQRRRGRQAYQIGKQGSERAPGV